MATNSNQPANQSNGKLDELMVRESVASARFVVKGTKEFWRAIANLMKSASSVSIGDDTLILFFEPLGRVEVSRYLVRSHYTVTIISNRLGDMLFLKTRVLSVLKDKGFVPPGV